MKIFSASRREDMPAFRMGKIVESFKKTPDGFFVLWTKDPRSILQAASQLDFSRVALQLTVTGLGGTEIEPGVPSPDIVWDALKGLIAKGLNRDLVNWRLDPIIPGVTTPKMVAALAGRVEDIGISRCITSFISFYDKVKERWPEWENHESDKIRQVEIIQTIQGILKPKGIQLYGCVQPHLSPWMFPAKCIDGDYYSKVTGFDFSTDKDGYQRKACGCTESVDIGSYRGCPHACRYCYARPEHEVDPQLDLF